MIEIILDCYDSRVYSTKATLQLHVRRVKNGMYFKMWDLDRKELVAIFRVSNSDFKEFLMLAKALLEMEVEEK